MVAPVTAIYRPLRNLLLEEMMRRGREASAAGTVRKQDVRGMIRALRANHAIWYAPDQSHRHKYSVVVPFFSIPAPTNSSTSRVARITGAAVVPFFPERRADGRGYRLIIGPALDDFPSGDDEADTRRIMRLIEDRARLTPADYLWVHRRFKPKKGDAAAVDYYAGL
jgi:KDO2-lipid IV(A) lauroyltransferase